MAKTPEEKAAEKAAKAAEKEAAAEENSEKTVKVTLRNALVWRNSRGVDQKKKPFDEIEVTEEQAEHLEASGQLASKKEIEAFKAGRIIDAE